MAYISRDAMDDFTLALRTRRFVDQVRVPKSPYFASIHEVLNGHTRFRIDWVGPRGSTIAHARVDTRDAAFALARDYLARLNQPKEDTDMPSKKKPQPQALLWSVAEKEFVAIIMPNGDCIYTPELDAAMVLPVKEAQRVSAPTKGQVVVVAQAEAAEYQKKHRAPPAPKVVSAFAKASTPATPGGAPSASPKRAQVAPSGKSGPYRPGSMKAEVYAVFATGASREEVIAAGVKGGATESTAKSWFAEFMRGGTRPQPK